MRLRSNPGSHVVENLTVAEGGNRIADTIYVSPGCACCLPQNDDPRGLHGYYMATLAQATLSEFK